MKYYLLVLVVVALIFFKVMNIAWLILTGLFLGFLIWFNNAINTDKPEPKTKHRP